MSEGAPASDPVSEGAPASDPVSEGAQSFSHSVAESLSRSVSQSDHLRPRCPPPAGLACGATRLRVTGRLHVLRCLAAGLDWAGLDCLGALQTRTHMCLLQVSMGRNLYQQVFLYLEEDYIIIY